MPAYLAASVSGRLEQPTRLSDDNSLALLYTAHYSSLVRLASLLLRDGAASEDVVQEAYIKVATTRSVLRDQDKALAYLRQTIVNLARSALRRRLVAIKYAPHSRGDLLDVESAADTAIRNLEGERVRAALAQLPTRQREAVVLRYYGDLSEAQIAAAMGVSNGAVKAYCSRGLAALAANLSFETGDRS